MNNYSSTMRGSRRVLVILFSFLTGVFLESFFGTSLSFFLLLVAGGVILVAMHPRAWTLFVLISMSFLTLGSMRTQAELAYWEHLPETIAFDGVVHIVRLEEPKTFYRPVILTAQQCEITCRAIQILFRAPLIFEAEPGDSFLFSCELKRPENFDPEFDYRSYLAGQNIGYICDRPKESLLLERPAHSWQRGLARLRDGVVTTFRSALPEPEASLALGLTLGGNDYLDREMKDIFARTGLSHIVAVSGFNIVILVQCILLLGIFLGLWRKQALIISVIFVALFLLLIGAPASALRAALMAGAAFLAYSFGRLTVSVNALLLAAVLMTLWHPLLLRYDVGFQLSFLATLALIVGGPLVDMFMPLEKWWAKILVVPLYTMIIELFTLPVLFGTFGQASLLAPLTNFLILPLVPIVMILALLLLPLFALLSALVPVLSFPLWLLLNFQVRLATWFAELPFGLIEYQDFTLLMGGVWYAILALFFWKLSRFRQTYVFRMDH